MSHIEPTTNTERAVQNRIIRLLQKYNGYEYIGNLKDTENSNIREDILRKFLMERQELTSAPGYGSHPKTEGGGRVR